MGIAGTLTGRVATFWCWIGIALLAGALPARAGDEVDYSAPYVTVENGELVTKYPAREHVAREAGTEADPPPDGGESRRAPPALIASALGVAIVAVAAVLRRAFARRGSR